jgi:hypothetical protein
MAPGKPIDHEPARTYDRENRKFVRSGAVHRTATDAARALDGPERENLAIAEQIGRGRSAGDEPEPEEIDGAWPTIVAALRRDWEQTKNHLMPDRAQHLGQTAVDTVRQATGLDEVPSGDKPNPPDTDIDWKDAEPAIRYGHDAAGRFPPEQQWDRDFEDRLSNEWRAGELGLPWSRVGHLVRFGWDYRRTHGDTY